MNLIRCDRHQTYRSDTCGDCLETRARGFHFKDHYCTHGLKPWWDCDPCRASATFGEDPMEPTFDEHISEEGAHITTRSERRRLMERNKLDYHDVSKKARGKRLYFDMRRG